jgi:DNA polymerase I-like protein with 3'-5' exonuclease and polymerase domains
MRYVFDIETDGLLRKLTTVHCVVAKDLDTQEVYRFDDSGRNSSVTNGLTLLMEADELWGHNILGFDVPAIQEIYPFFKPWNGKLYDTLILSRMFFTDMLDRDLRAKPANMPGNLYGRHSLESWGYRLGVLKSEYGKQLHGDWSVYTPEMLDYCTQDVEANYPLVKMFEPKLEEYQRAIDLEHKCAEIMAWQEQAGYPFDVYKAHALESRLRTEIETLSDQMRATFTFVAGKEFVPRRNDATRGYVTGAPMTRLTEFSPTSRDHIAWAFQKHRGWEPTDFTDTGKPKIDEDVLLAIGTEESKQFARILELQKALGLLSEGKNSWLQMVEKDGCIHHSCLLNTATGRNVHLRPNLAQVPSSHECRELFYAGKDRIQVGADASGLELRCLAHYLARYDGGSFGKTVVEGDIHQAMADISGVDRRTQKVITYCMIYGGGDVKLGLSAGASKKEASARGKELRAKLLDGIEGFRDLVTAVQKRAESGVIYGIDGRPIRIKKSHASLNYLLQSCGASICKMWVVRTNELLKEAGVDYTPLAFVHDEMQLSVAPEHVEMVKTLIPLAMKDVEYAIKFRTPLDCEVQSGLNWGDTH